MSGLEALDRTVRLVCDAVDDGVSDAEIVGALQSFRVRCVCDARNAQAYSGQTALVAIVSLVARMGVQINLDVPDVPLVGYQPPLRGSRLVSSLIDLGSDLIPGSAITADPTLKADLTIALGDTPLRGGTAGWRVSGDGWAAQLTPLGHAGTRWSASSAIGGLTGAGLVSPEVFKAVIRGLPLRHPIWTEMLAEAGEAVWGYWGDETAYPCDPVPLDIISAGAITQAALFALLRTPMHLTGRVFDDDVAEFGNLNRQMLYRRSDTGLKVDIVRRAFRAPGRCNAIPERFSEAGLSRFAPLAPHVLVGVDDIPARWEIQAASRGWTGVGATSHFFASISSHEEHEGCAGCLHPRDDDGLDGPIPTVSFVSFWAGLALAVRFLRAIGGGPYGARRQNLALWPLRLDSLDAASWHPVGPRRDCPVRCSASQRNRAA